MDDPRSDLGEAVTVSFEVGEAHEMMGELVARLSETELAVLSLRVFGWSEGDIACKLGITRNGVVTARRRIMKKAKEVGFGG